MLHPFHHLSKTAPGELIHAHAGGKPSKGGIKFTPLAPFMAFSISLHNLKNSSLPVLNSGEVSALTKDSGSYIFPILYLPPKINPLT